MTDQSSKVVNLHSRREPGLSSAPLPEALVAIRDKSHSFLQSRIAVFLDEVDDTLFELADEASNAREQHLYFDAMREIRVNRENIEKCFSETFLNAFAALASGSKAGSALERGQAKLKLLESEALEELVALEGMANKAERRFLHEVWILCTAWQQVVSGPVVAAKELPMGPAKIAAAMGVACQTLDIDIKAKLVLFKLFDKSVIATFGDLYQIVVPVLDAQGLPLEQLEKKSAKNADAHKESASDKDATSQASQSQNASIDIPRAAELVTRLFDALDNLLGKAATNQTGPKTAISKPSFMVALQEMQNEQYAQFNIKIPVDGGVQTDFTLMGQKLVARLQQVNWVSNTDISALSFQRDQDTINFVGALFQFILDGDGIAESLKGLIARLQIPVLKMAMLDKGFFSHDEHPARKLLSALVSAGIGWSPVAGLDKDPLYKKTEEVVMRVLRDFGVDTQVFVDAYEDFSAFSEKAKRRAELVARRTIDAEDGKASAENARMYIAAILESKLGGVDCPPVVTKILQLGWSKVLFLSYIQHGKDSERFSDDAGLIERLLWSVLPSDDSGHRNELISALPVLVETLRLGFTRVSLNTFETDRWFDQLERLHLAKLSRKATVQASALSDETDIASESGEGLGVDSSANGSDIDPVMLKSGASLVSSDDAELAGLDASLAASLDDERDKTLPVHSMPLMPQVPAKATVSETSKPELEQLVSRIQTLRVGNWVDFRQDDGRMLRCRLAAVINGIGKYIFVNRSGIKVAELNRDELEAALIEQKVLLIDDDRMFDRALESVISNLRDMKDKPL
ncbi:DUF1631 domain-containing protein [Zhongshania sp. BJYM1]|uniref:DUF1631 domain-containing protein n=1 Tax=Zhongshania aquatica TaxID=2965069 RepID=UPI0022B42711|nr:DUF1631 domain-containing protein [Marortus sp. BJYM1]